MIFTTITFRTGLMVLNKEDQSTVKAMNNN